MALEIKVESKKEKTIRKAREAKDKIVQFCIDHKEALLVIIPVLVSGTIELIKIAARNGSQKEDKYLKENYIYDRSAGHYYELQHKPSSSEWKMIDHRKSEGELLGDILTDMDILK